MTREQVKNRVLGYNGLTLFFCLLTFFTAFFAMFRNVYNMLIVSILCAIIAVILERKKKGFMRAYTESLKLPAAQHSPQLLAGGHD